MPLGRLRAGTFRLGTLIAAAMGAATPSKRANPAGRMQTETRHSDRLARRAIARAASGAVGIKESNQAHRDPLSSAFQAGSVEQGSPDRPEAPAQAEKCLAIRVRLQLEGRKRDLALFNLAIDSKLGGCDLLPCRSMTYGRPANQDF